MGFGGEAGDVVVRWVCGRDERLDNRPVYPGVCVGVVGLGSNRFWTRIYRLMSVEEAKSETSTK